MVYVTDVEALAPATRISFPAPTTVNSHQRDNVEKRSQSGHIITPCISTLIHLQGVLLTKKRGKSGGGCDFLVANANGSRLKVFGWAFCSPFLRGDIFNVTHGAGRVDRK